MQIYEESLEEMRQKLDISQLMEKLTFYDRSLSVLFDESQLKLLYLQEKFNFQEVRDERNMLGLRNDIVANLFGMIAENSKNAE
jgi:predicted nucleic acid-binding protein